MTQLTILFLAVLITIFFTVRKIIKETRIIDTVYKDFTITTTDVEGYYFQAVSKRNESVKILTSNKDLDKFIDRIYFEYLQKKVNREMKTIIL